MDGESLRQTVNRFRFHVAAVLTLRWWLTLTALWGLAWGVAVLVLRAIVGWPAAPLAWGALGLAVPVPVAFVLALRRLPTRAAVVALIDRTGRCGGWLMASCEVDLGRWASTLSTPAAAPCLRWHWGRPVALWAAAAVFVAVGFAVPQRFIVASAARPLEIDKEVGILAAQIETLREERILEPERADALQKQLDRVAAEARGDDPVKTWEALDHLHDAASSAARAAAEDALRRTEQLAPAEALASTLARDAADLSPAALAEAMKQLADKVHAAAEQDEALAQCLSESQLGQACQDGSLDPAACAELAKALAQCKNLSAAQLGHLVKVGLIDPSLIDQNGCLGQCDGSELAALLEGCGGGEEGGDSLQAWLQGGAGSGGVDRGRGDAPLTWKDPSTKEGTDFVAKALPPAFVEAMKQSRQIGVSAAAPEVTQEGGASSGGALGGAAAGGGSAQGQVVLPRHKGAVHRYFERSEP